MEGVGSFKCRPVEITWGQSYPGSEVLEPNHLDGNRTSTRLDFQDKHRIIHEPPVISPVMVQGHRRPTGRVIAEEPHI